MGRGPRESQPFHIRDWTRLSGSALMFIVAKWLFVREILPVDFLELDTSLV